MNRVWKRFLFKVAKGLGAIGYVFGSILLGGLISHWLGYDPEAGILAGALVMVVLPMVAFMLRDVYRDAKEEVERENRKMMSALRGSEYDF